MTFWTFASIVRRAVWVVAVLVTTAPVAVAAAKGPVKVFILAGQSNMEGKAAARTLEPAIADPGTRDDFKHLKKDGRWTVRDDVWVTFLCKNVKGPAGDFPLYGPLTVGFGGQKFDRDENNRRVRVASIGPELGFGHVVGNHFDEQVLLIKTAWGGKSVRKHFLPPSAGGPGEDYTKMIEEVRKVLGELKKYFPEYDAEKGYELAGLVWFQGWNDGVGKGNPDYTEQLAHLIRDVRKDLNAPDLPVVIGELGIDGLDARGWIATFRREQQAVAELEEFKDNVRFARTARFWPKWYGSLDARWREFRARSKAWEEEMNREQGRKPTKQEIREFGDKHWREPNRATIARMSDKRYHYMGSGETYYRMGEAFGEAMLELVK